MEISTILVSKLLKLQSAMANKNTDMVEIFLKSPNVRSPWSQRSEWANAAKKATTTPLETLHYGV